MAQPDAPHLIPASTHAERNPELQVQSCREREQPTKMQKAARLIRSQIAKKKHKQLISDLDEALSNHSKALEALAKKHSVKMSYLHKLSSHSLTFKKKRTPNIHNAMIHAKSMEVNEGAF